MATRKKGKKAAPKKAATKPKSRAITSKQASMDEKPSQAETLAKYRKNYTKSKTALGNNSAHCGDDIAARLASLTPEDVVTLAEKVLKFKTGELKAKYAHLNPGATRMNAGNRIRAAIKRGDVTVEALS